MTKKKSNANMSANGDGLPKKKRRSSLKTTGSPQIKHNRWYAVLAIPGKDGKKHTKWFPLDLDATNGKNKKKAVELTEQLKSKYNAGQIIYSEDILFADWVKKWLKHHAKEVSESTMEGYRTYAKRDIYPFYNERGTILQDMRAVDVQDFYDHLFDRGLCADSIRRYRAVIRGSLEYAYRMEIIPNNPAAKAVIPKSPPKPPVSKAYTAEEALALLDAIKDSPLYPVVFLTLMLGLRREEIAGLKWSAIDLEQKKVYIRHTRTRVRSEISSDSTKTLSSNRELSLSDSVCRFLKELQRQQTLEKLELGENYQNTEYVARFKDGRPMSPGYISSTFNALLKKHNLPHIRFHDLRDTAATLMLSNGIDPKTLQEYLGHSKFSTTADRYLHPSFKEKAKAADCLAAVLCPAVAV